MFEVEEVDGIPRIICHSCRKPNLEVEFPKLGSGYVLIHDWFWGILKCSQCGGCYDNGEVNESPPAEPLFVGPQ